MASQGRPSTHSHKAQKAKNAIQTGITENKTVINFTDIFTYQQVISMAYSVLL